MGLDPGKRDDDAIVAKRRAATCVGTVVGGRYRVEELLALGGMGAVFRAEHVHMRKRVALKVLHPSTQNLPELVTRFQRESIVGAHVAHPNVCQATDFGKLDDGSHYLVLEFVEGHTLQDELKRGPVDPARAAEIAHQIAAGLGAAHDLGIVHRDVKPANVMVLDAGGTGDGPQVKIVDFGLAKLPTDRFRIGEDLTVTSAGTVFGTVSYMAPELARGMAAVDRRSDLYALGVILYEMLAGKHPFEGPDSVSLFRQHVRAPLPPIIERAPGILIPKPLERVVRRLLAKDPNARYKTARELMDALDKACPPRPAGSRLGPLRELRDGPAEEEAREVEPPSEPPPPRVKPRGRRSGKAASVTLLVGSVVVAGLVTARLLGLGVSPHEPAPAADATPAASPVASVGSGPFVPVTAPSTSAAAPPSAASLAAIDAGAPAAAASTPSGAVAPSTPLVLPPEAIQARAFMSVATVSRDGKRAVASLLALAKAAPTAFGNRDIVAESAAVAVMVAIDPALADQVFGLLAGPALGDAGPDVLFYVTSFYGGSRAAARAAELLADPAVLARASPGLRVARDLKNAACRDRPALYDRAASEGDERALVLLSQMLAADCGEAMGGCCTPHDPTLAAATSRLRQRLRR